MTSLDQGTSSSAVLITGASSGIGAALAEAYATKGRRLVLLGRDAGRLDAVAAACAAQGAATRTGLVDVTDAAALATWINEVDGDWPIGLAIANAGVSAGGARHIMEVNVGGLIATIEAVLPCMRRRGFGHLGLMSSLGGFRGMPSAPAYCASKAAVRSYGEGLRPSLTGDGITVSVICPGFVRTKLTEHNPFSMPMIMDPGKAARIIKNGLDRKKTRIAFPWPLYAAMRLLASLPPALVDPMLRGLPSKE